MLSGHHSYEPRSAQSLDRAESRVIEQDCSFINVMKCSRFPNETLNCLKNLYSNSELQESTQIFKFTAPFSMLDCYPAAT